MRSLSIFLYEWKHFFRNPFKIVALLLFCVAGVYGLNNGSRLYQKQIVEIGKIKEKVEEEKQKYLSQYEQGKLSDDARPWVDMGHPYWAIWYTPTYHLKMPSPAMVYSIGQAEQYVFYKHITFWASPYDPGMAEEIANPERLQTGTLDFSFVLLFLSPLLLLILLYNLKSAETEQGFMPLIEVQTTSKNKWLLARIAFYYMLVGVVIIGLLVYGAFLTNVFETRGSAFGEILAYTFLYLTFWSIIYFLILKNGKTIVSNSLQMVGIWLLFAFIVPAAVHQIVSIAKPVNLMTEFIEVRDEQQKLYSQPDSIFQTTLNTLFPDIVNSVIYSDSTKTALARRRSTSALVNELKKESVKPIEQDSRDKNKLIRATYWFNPVSFFQNQLNRISRTHYADFKTFRQDIQRLIDKRTKVLVSDIWNDVRVDKDRYLRYNENLNGVE